MESDKDTLDLPTITVTKGTEATEKSVTSVVQFLKLLYPEKTVKVIDTVTCLDIPPEAIQIIYPNGEEAVFAPDPTLTESDVKGEKDVPPTVN